MLFKFENNYPSFCSTRIKDMILDLDLAPKDRWTKLVAPKTVQVTIFFGHFLGFRKNKVQVVFILTAYKDILGSQYLT